MRPSSRWEASRAWRILSSKTVTLVRLAYKWWGTLEGFKVRLRHCQLWLIAHSAASHASFFHVPLFLHPVTQSYMWLNWALNVGNEGLWADIYTYVPLAILRRASLLYRMAFSLLWSLLLLGLLPGESVPAYCLPGTSTSLHVGWSFFTGGVASTGSQTVCKCLYMCLRGWEEVVCVEVCVLSSQIMQTLIVSCHSHIASESQGAWTSYQDVTWLPGGPHSSL